MARIRVNDGIILARKVLREVERGLSREDAARWEVVNYANGREQGLALLDFPEVIFFAEARSSDHILVCHGIRQAHQNCPVSEEEWAANLRCFSSGSIKKAARYIRRVMGRGSEAMKIKGAKP
jgi:hypothetical protein